MGRVIYTSLTNIYISFTTIIVFQCCFVKKTVMKTLILFVLLCSLTLAGKSQINCKAKIINADTLIKNISVYNNKHIFTEGNIAHVCGVDGKKMKLKAASGEIIKLVPNDSLNSFGKEFNGKLVRIYGTIKESRIEMPYALKHKDNKSILCHVDNTPCLDSAWVNKHKKTGYADTISSKSTAKLIKKIKDSDNGYYSTATIYVEDISIIEKN